MAPSIGVSAFVTRYPLLEMDRIRSHHLETMAETMAESVRTMFGGYFQKNRIDIPGF